MRAVLLLPTLFAALTALPSVGGRSDLPAALLPEVHRHLDDAERALNVGDAANAQAHANLVLVGSTIDVAVRMEGLTAREANDADTAANRAFDTWAIETDDDVKFRRDDDAADPTVVIRCMKDVVRGGENLAGWVSWKRTMPTDGSAAKYRAEIMIRTRRTDGRRMSPAALHHEICHELGHVLGLDDTPKTGVLMGPLDPCHPCDGPSEREAEIVRELRRKAHAVARSAGRSQ